MVKRSVRMDICDVKSTKNLTTLRPQTAALRHSVGGTGLSGITAYPCFEMLMKGIFRRGSFKLAPCVGKPKRNCG